MSLTRRELGLVGLGSVLVALLYWRFAFLRLDALSIHDWHAFYHQWEAGRVAFERYRELALWTPYHCGGLTLFGDPLALMYSPLFWILYPLGTTIGMKVYLVLHAAVGFAGMYVVARRHLSCQPPAAMLAAAIWAGSGFFAWHVSVGHVNFLPAFYLPWLFLAWRRSLQSLHWCAATALVWAFALYGGGLYVFVYFGLFLLFDGVAQLCGERRWQAVRAGGLTLVVTLFVSAFRLLPSLETWRRHPRLTTGDDWLSPGEMLDVFTSGDHDTWFDHEFRWHEYGAYIGWMALVMVLVGAVLAWRGKHRILLVGALLFVALSFGDAAPWSPWHLLHRAPGFASLRVASRFVVLSSFFMALLAALTVQSLTFSSRRLTQLTRALLVLAVVVDIFSTNYTVTTTWTAPPFIKESPSTAFFQDSSRPYGLWANFPRLNIGHPGCYASWAYEVAILWSGPKPQVAVRGPGTVLTEERTVNTVSARVLMQGPGHVVFNQTWDRDWKSSVGRVEKALNGQLEVVLPRAGEYSIKLTYEPAWFVSATILTLIGLVIAGLLLWAPAGIRFRLTLSGGRARLT